MRILLIALSLLVAAPVSANEIAIRLKCPTCTADGVIGYTVRLGNQAGGPWTLRSQVYPITPPDEDGIISLPFDATGLPPGVYFDIAEAFNLDATSPPSNERTIIIPTPPVQLLNTSAIAALLWMRGMV
jgi:hypothetical protein